MACFPGIQQLVGLAHLLRPRGICSLALPPHRGCSASRPARLAGGVLPEDVYWVNTSSGFFNARLFEIA